MLLLAWRVTVIQGEESVLMAKRRSEIDTGISRLIVRYRLTPKSSQRILRPARNSAWHMVEKVARSKQPNP